MSNVQDPKGLIGQLQNAFQEKVNIIPDAHQKIIVSTKYKEDPVIKMKAVEWHGKEKIKVVERPAPTITDPRDCIVRITSTTVCGSDLHLYYHEVPGGSAVMHSGNIMGHEGCGIVTAVGPDVKNVKVGDRVVIAFAISCGECEYCKEGKFTMCDVTNPSKLQEDMYGHRLAGLFGYSHYCGGYAGLQAEYARVPIADSNTLKITNDSLRDDQILALSDIICTGNHGNECANVKEGSKVVVWGCGPVGIMAIYLALHRKASIVVGIDNHPHRLSMAAKLGAKTINFDDGEVTDQINKLIPGGPTSCIDCVGFRFPKSWKEWIQQKLYLQSDCSEVIKEAIYVCKKGGTIGLIGDYFGTTNGFPIGAFMEKGLTMSGGQAFVQKYWKDLLSSIEKGELDPSFVFTHTMKLEDADKAYDIFANVKDDVVKIILKTKFGDEFENENKNKNKLPQ